MVQRKVNLFSGISVEILDGHFRALLTGKPASICMPWNISTQTLFSKNAAFHVLDAFKLVLFSWIATLWFTHFLESPKSIIVNSLQFMVFCVALCFSDPICDLFIIKMHFSTSLFNVNRQSAIVWGEHGPKQESVVKTAHSTCTDFIWFSLCMET